MDMRKKLRYAYAFAYAKFSIWPTLELTFATEIDSIDIAEANKIKEKLESIAGTLKYTRLGFILTLFAIYTTTRVKNLN